MPQANKPPIINCHVHTFTGDYVPPFLAKTYLPEPIHRIFSMRFIIMCIRWYYDTVKPLFFKNRYKWLKRKTYEFQIFIKRHYILGIIKLIVETYLVVAIFYYLGTWFLDIDYQYKNIIQQWLVKALVFLKESGIIIVVPSLFFKIVFFIIILIVFKSIRNLVFALLRQFKILPGKHFTDLFFRYVQIGLFSKYKTQKGIYDKLKKQYPVNTHFVGLPMDMQFMDAGNLKKGFTIQTQMQGILDIKKRPQDKDTFHPFVFADPRRMADKTYFDYAIEPKTGNVLLTKGCLMQQYLEDHNFAGIKIYPALGYYPFDEALLPLWKYCVQNNLPVMSHCIKGTIFYRGKKKPIWDNHQIFTEGKIDSTKFKATTNQDDDEHNVDFDFNADYITQDDKALHLNEVKNIDFANNFTNPLNYLCLLDEKLLYKVIKQSTNTSQLQQLFPCDEANTTVQKGKGLSSLKLCFAHFGGDDQWKRFLESDRDNYTSQLILQPQKGIDFFKNANGEDSPGKLAYIWKYVDWYTIICSIMLQYKNVYADISYILHDEVILPLLKQTLSNDGLKPKVLYGSDFYVVRNHKSDKAILADMRAGLTESEFDQIARYNPKTYLNLP